jgi:hypothetical protein
VEWPAVEWPVGCRAVSRKASSTVTGSANAVAIRAARRRLVSMPAPGLS